MTEPRTPTNRILRLNIGFMLREGAGYVRKVEFAIPGDIRADDVDLADLNGSVLLTRTPQGVLGKGDLTVLLPTSCTRCLTDFQLEVPIQFEELFLLHREDLPSSSDPLTLITEGGFIDLTPIVREEALLSETIQVLCKADCKGLCSQCGQNLNEAQCDCDDTSIDPRLAVLRELLNNE